MWRFHRENVFLAVIPILRVWLRMQFRKPPSGLLPPHPFPSIILEDFCSWGSSSMILADSHFHLFRWLRSQCQNCWFISTCKDTRASAGLCFPSENNRQQSYLEQCCVPHCTDGLFGWYEWPALVHLWLPDPRDMPEPCKNGTEGTGQDPVTSVPYWAVRAQSLAAGTSQQLMHEDGLAFILYENIFKI